MFDRLIKVGLPAAILSFATAAPSAGPAGRPELFTKLVECRSIPDSAPRLACYDAQVGALDAAEKKKDVVMMDRKQVRETRRSLFGFTLPKFSLGGDKEDSSDDVNEMESTIASVHEIAGGNWALTLANDAGSWETTSSLAIPPRRGDKVKIAKAALGSYKGNIGPNRVVRFRRVG